MSSSRGVLRDPGIYIVFGITLIGVMGVSAIAPAFPQIAEELSLSTEKVGLLVTVFTIPGILVAPSLGFLSDRIGRKCIVVPSLLLFAAAGMGCAAAPSFPVLLILRTLQGLGASALTSLSVTLIGDMYESDRRNAAVGYNASILSVGTAAYPAIGGLLASVSWRLPFLLSGAGLIIGLAALFWLHSPRPEKSNSAGAQLKAVLQNARRSGIVIIFVLGLLQFILLYGAYLTYVPFLLKSRFAAGTSVVGLMMSSMSAATAVLASRHKHLAAKHRTGRLLFFAFGCELLSLLLFSFVPRLSLVPLATVLFGIGQGIIIPTIQGTIAARSPLELRGATMSVNAMAIRIGQTLGPLLAGAVFSGYGIRSVFWASALLAAFMLSLSRWTFSMDSDRMGEK